MATANEKLQEKLNELREDFAAMTAKMDSNGKQINRVYEALYGNGKPGLISEFQQLRSSVEQHHRAESESKVDLKWIVTTLVAIAAIVVGFVK